MTASTENTPAMIVIRLPESTGLPSTVTYATNGVPVPITRLAREAPTERHVDKEALSVGSGEIADAMDPYGILIDV